MGEIAKQTEVDLAYQVLQENRQVMYFRDLLTKVLMLKKVSTASLAHSMAEVHTQINMDSRFVHMGKGMWGLTEWLSSHNSAHVAAGIEMAVEEAAEDGFSHGSQAEGANPEERE
jgi:DNA-directed RNA polymerase subunit delta